MLAGNYSRQAVHMVAALADCRMALVGSCAFHIHYVHLSDSPNHCHWKLTNECVWLRSWTSRECFKENLGQVSSASSFKQK